MIREVFENGVTFLYEYRNISHSSFCIGLEAGANAEDEKNIGVAHALEHFLFKGTENYGEEEINKKLDGLFGFSNAMTNFPYVIYYGTTFNDDFEDAFNLYSDIILKPSFTEEGFKEEISVIKQELSDWKGDLEQFCEDKLLYNSLFGERIGKRIIGTEDDIEEITLEKMKEFHNDFYVSENLVVSVVTSLDYDYVKQLVLENFGVLSKKAIKLKEERKRVFKSGYYEDNRGLYKGAKIQIIFDISELTLEEVKGLRILNMYLGEGVSSLFYDEIRTKRGLAYEVASEVKWEKGIRLFSIAMSTTKDSVNEAISAVENILENIKELKLSKEEIKNLVKRYKMKSSLEIERSIVLANRMAINEILNGNGEIPIEDAEKDFKLSSKKVNEIIKKVFKNKAIEVLK
ncbi:M16 family metallopeptidase [Clostridium massiliamazoniense]|uniref:M16 family metallopeptidase n=1 Tax=Clostridium massiliamazoniense TaxID=1347366 RepID=UPI0006D7CD98|nr:pitrilysin family protein [Clostridium massiliamazoniense]